MALKALLKEAPPKELEGHYKKNEAGAWVLDVEGVDGYALEDVASLRTAYASEKEARRKATAAVEAWKSVELTPEQVAALKEENEQLKASGSDATKVKTAVESATRQILARHETEMKTLKEREAFLQGELKRTTVDTAIEVALAKKALSPQAVKLLQPHAGKGVEMREIDGKIQVVVLDEGGNPRITPRSGGGTSLMTIDDRIEEMSKSADYEIAFKGTKAAGSGKSGADGTGGAPGGAGDDITDPVERMKIARRQAAQA